MIVKIMTHLPPSSLYLFRQSLTIFLRIFDDRAFHLYHGKLHIKTQRTEFRLDSIPSDEREDIPPLLHSSLYCSQCLDSRHSEEHASKMTRLDQMIFCHGCRENHARILFSPKSIERYNNGAEEHICIGRLGRVTLCSHAFHQPVTWKTEQRHANPPRGFLRAPSLSWSGNWTWQTVDDYDYMSRNVWKLVVCTDRSHRASGKWENNFGISSFPRLLLRGQSQHCLIDVRWDVPLLDINPGRRPTAQAIRETLSSLVGGAFSNHKPCKHISASRHIRDFVHSGICECFALPSNPVYLSHDSPDPYYNKDRACSCPRQRYLECRDCGAFYSRHLIANRIFL